MDIISGILLFFGTTFMVLGTQAHHDVLSNIMMSLGSLCISNVMLIHNQGSASVILSLISLGFSSACIMFFWRTYKSRKRDV